MSALQIDFARTILDYYPVNRNRLSLMKNKLSIVTRSCVFEIEDHTNSENDSENDRFQHNKIDLKFEETMNKLLLVRGNFKNWMFLTLTIFEFKAINNN